jgi:hypothetical protein
LRQRTRLRRLRLVVSLAAAGFALAGRASAADPEAPPSSSPPQHPTRVAGEAGYGSSTTSGGSTGKTTNQFLYERASATYGATSGLEVGAGARITEDFAQSRAQGSPYATGSDVVVALSILANIDFTDAWSLGLGGLLSPTSTREIATSVTDAGARRDALVETRSDSAGAFAEVAYDSFDEEVPHDVDVELVLGGAATRFGTSEDVRAGVATLPPASSAALWQGRFTLTTTLTIFDHTDVGLEASGYVYNASNPGDVGLFDVTSRGTTTSFGTGLPTLPPRWALHPEVVHRFGRLSIRAGYQVAALALDGSGLSHAVDGRVQVTLGLVKLYLAGAFRRDALDSKTTADIWVLSGGGSVRF